MEWIVGTLTEIAEWLSKRMVMLPKLGETTVEAIAREITRAHGRIIVVLMNGQRVTTSSFAATGQTDLYSAQVMA